MRQKRRGRFQVRLIKRGTGAEVVLGRVAGRQRAVDLAMDCLTMQGEIYERAELVDLGVGGGVIARLEAEPLDLAAPCDCPDCTVVPTVH